MGWLALSLGLEEEERGSIVVRFVLELGFRYRRSVCVVGNFDKLGRDCWVVFWECEYRRLWLSVEVSRRRDEDRGVIYFYFWIESGFCD